MMKKLFLFLSLLLLSVSNTALSEVHPYVPLEMPNLQIKVSADGTGIVKGVSCLGCNYKIAKITKNSRAYKNGKMVNMLEAQSRAGKFAMVSFNPDTREVQAIRWSE